MTNASGSLAGKTASIALFLASDESSFVNRGEGGGGVRNCGRSHSLPLVGDDYMNAGGPIVGKIVGSLVGRLLVCSLAVPKARKLASYDADEQAPYTPAAHRQ